MTDPREVSDAVTERLQAALPGWQMHAYLPSENPPHITVYDGDGNVVHDADVPVVVWEPVEPVPTMTVRVECSDEWTDLGP
jgi:hypothetical protein